MLIADASSFGPVASAWIEFLGHLHPVVLHFPLALLLVGGVAVVWNWLRGEEGVGEFAFHCIWIGAAMSVVAAASGWFFAEHESSESGLELHRWFAIGATAAAVLVAGLATLARTDERPGLVAVTRLATLATAAGMAFAGHLGGNMVWGDDAVTKPLWAAIQVTWKQAGETERHEAAPTKSAEPAKATEPAKPAEPSRPSVPEKPAEPAAAAEPAKPTETPKVHGEIFLGAVGDEVPPPVEPKERPVSFKKTVLPLLKDKCFECHSGEEPKDGVAFDHMDELIKSEGKRAVVMKGDPAKSTMFTSVMKADGNKKRMPPPKKGPRLTPEQAGIIQAWIKEGAKVES